MVFLEWSIEMIVFFYMHKRTFAQAPRPYKGYYEICLISLRSVFTTIKCVSEQSWWHPIIKDVPTQKEIWSLANKNIRAGRDWRGWEFENFLTERKHGTVIFLTAIAWVGVIRSLFFQKLVVSGLRVWLWRVLRITVTVEFSTWVNKVFHGPSWPTLPCLQVLF